MCQNLIKKFLNYFFAGILKVNDENSRIRIHLSEAWIRGSGSTPKCHGSGTLLQIISNIRILITGRMFVVFTVPVSCWLMPHQKGRKLLRLLTPLLWLLLA
jgi:hypothetical protein